MLAIPVEGCSGHADLASFAVSAPSPRCGGPADGRTLPRRWTWMLLRGLVVMVAGVAVSAYAAVGSAPVANLVTKAHPQWLKSNCAEHRKLHRLLAANRTAEIDRRGRSAWSSTVIRDGMRCPRWWGEEGERAGQATGQWRREGDRSPPASLAAVSGRRPLSRSSSRIVTPSALRLLAGHPHPTNTMHEAVSARGSRRDPAEFHEPE